MRLQSLSHALLYPLVLVVWSAPVRAEHSRASFPEAPDESSAVRQRPAPAVRVTAAKIATAPSESAALDRAPPSRPLLGTPNPAPGRERDDTKAAQIRRDWLLSLEGVTHAPIDMGVHHPRG